MAEGRCEWCGTDIGEGHPNPDCPYHQPTGRWRISSFCHEGGCVEVAFKTSSFWDSE